MDGGLTLKELHQHTLQGHALSSRVILLGNNPGVRSDKRCLTPPPSIPCWVPSNATSI